MGWRAQAWILTTLFMALAGCGLFQSPSPPIYQDASLTVRLEPNPAGSVLSSTETGAQRMTPELLALILRGLRARKQPGLLQSLLLPSQPDPVFLEDELPLVARELNYGLRAASPWERVAFQLFRPGREETSGAVYQRGPLLYVTLSKFRSPDHVSYEGSEEGFDFFYEPSEAAVQKRTEPAKRRREGEKLEVVIDVQRFKETSVAGAVQSAPSQAPRAVPAPNPDIVESLQRRVKELTEANLALRAKLQEFQNQRDQSEEMNRLRQELAETKQVLADKVIELNRSKSKAGGGAKGKAQSPPGR